MAGLASFNSNSNIDHAAPRMADSEFAIELMIALLVAVRIDVDRSITGNCVWKLGRETATAIGKASADHRAGSDDPFTNSLARV